MRSLSPHRPVSLPTPARPTPPQNYLADLRKDFKTQAESMAQLTKMMTMFLRKIPGRINNGEQ